MRTPSVRQLKDGRTEAVTDYVVTAYRTGDLEVAPLALWFLTAEGDSGRLSSDAVRLVVRSVLPENESDIRDIRGPVEMRTRVPLWLWLGLAVLVAAVFVLWRYFRRRRGATVQEAESPPVDWYAELEKIGRMGLLDRGEYKKHYSLVSDVVRRHLEGRAGVEAMESTTFEVAWRLRQTRVSETYVSDLEGFLADADLVKFAKMRPPEQAALAAVDRARDLMRRIEREHRSPEADEDGVAPAPTTGPTP